MIRNKLEALSSSKFTQIQRNKVSDIFDPNPNPKAQTIRKDGTVYANDKFVCGGTVLYNNLVEGQICLGDIYYEEGGAWHLFKQT